jgi:NAD(P)-dependent dehydrogenase (short-subunit alcohol dehydrogenase family)
LPTFLITGASQGIGAEVARQFSHEGDACVVLVSRNEAKLRNVVATCSADATVAVEVCDVTDEAAVARMADSVTSRFGVPDVVVNNAGTFRPGGILDTSIADFRAQVDVNLNSAFIVTKAFLGGMISRASGLFIQMASVAAIRGYPAGVAYCASKHGLLGLSRALREETRGSGIRVTTLIPGATWTPSWDGSGHAEERMIPATDVAALALSVWRLGDRSVVEEIVVRPQLGDL